MNPKSFFPWPLLLFFFLPFSAPAQPQGGLRQTLASSLEAKRVPPDLFVSVGWREDGVRYRTLEIWADGVGIQDGSLQFHLVNEEILVLVKNVLESWLPEMEERVRSRDDRETPGVQGIRIRTRVVVRAGGAVRDVYRTIKDAPSPELEELVRSTISLCSGPVARGVRAESMDDAFDKMRKGVVAPQALRLTFQVSAEKADAAGVRPGWLLRLEGRDLEVRTTSPESGVGPIEKRRITEGERRSLLKALRGARLDTAPAVLYSERYEDLSVAALGHEKALQARRFAGLHPGATPHQKRYEKLRRALQRLEGSTPAP